MTGIPGSSGGSAGTAAGLAGRCAWTTALLLFTFGTATAQNASGPGQPLWPDKPIHVDRASQSLERLPAKPGAKMEAKPERYPLRLNRAHPYTVIDSVSFVQAGKKYRLTNLHPVPSAKVCKNQDGMRWACGLKSRVALSRLLRGKLIRCLPLGESDGFTLVECMLNNKDLGGVVVAAGFALTQQGQERYRAEEDDARKRGLGVWAAETVLSN